MKIIETEKLPIKKWLEEIKVSLALMELVEKWEEIKHKKNLNLEEEIKNLNDKGVIKG
jgi:ERCC4-related helicase